MKEHGHANKKPAGGRSSVIAEGGVGTWQGDAGPELSDAHTHVI